MRARRHRKTRLALRLLTSMAAEFPDGAWFVELADLRQPDLVISRVAAALGVSEEPGRPLLETLADVLRRRRLLLALDNCEHLIDACAEVSGQLLASSPGLRLVITSRESSQTARTRSLDHCRLGFLVTSPTMETAMPGVFAAGDVRSGSTKQLGSAVGDGIAALLMTRRYLETHHHKAVPLAPAWR